MPGTISPRSSIGTSRPNGASLVGLTDSPHTQPRGTSSTHGLVQPLPLAVRVQPTRVSTAIVPIRLPSSPGSRRTGTVRVSWSDRVPSGKSGSAAGPGLSGAGRAGSGSATGPGAGRSLSFLEPHAATSSASPQTVLLTVPAH